MSDIHDKKTRSYNMSRVRSENTNPEILVRRFLHSKGFRFRLYSKDLPGKPDVILPKYKTAIFIHGCFWHGHSQCKYFNVPKTNSDWWYRKIENSKIRDSKNEKRLKELGWNVIVIWSCQLKGNNQGATLNNLFQSILSTKEL